MPFEVYGHPEIEGTFSFTPRSIEGVASNPKFKGQVCYGKDLRDFSPLEGWSQLFLEFLIDAYDAFPDKKVFFTSYFEKLAGTASLRKQIEAGWKQDQIRESWSSDIENFMDLRKESLIYD